MWWTYEWTASKIDLQNETLNYHKSTVLHAFHCETCTMLWDFRHYFLFTFHPSFIEIYSSRNRSNIADKWTTIIVFWEESKETYHYPLWSKKGCHLFHKWLIMSMPIIDIRPKKTHKHAKYSETWEPLKCERPFNHFLEFFLCQLLSKASETIKWNWSSVELVISTVIRLTYVLLAFCAKFTSMNESVSITTISHEWNKII